MKRLRSLLVSSLAFVLFTPLMTNPLLAADTASKTAPPFTLPIRDGSISLESFKGKVVYLDFWASWCEPCKKSFPWMTDLQSRFGPEGLVVVAVNLDKKRELADAFVEKNKPPFAVAYDPAGKTPEAYGVKVMPTSFLIAPDGTIAQTHAGFDPKKAEAVEAEIKALLAAMPKKEEQK
ncbi:MAG: TlpA disulfide reductase family protein [Candidatus Eisenbacteria bacterium]